MKKRGIINQKALHKTGLFDVSFPAKAETDRITQD
jgi:hypothetical protein